jgi:hypothetical protein
VGYTIFNSRFIVQGPEIHLDQTGDVIKTTDRTLFLTGKILHSSFITINGRPIFIDESGNFNEKLLLSSGVSIIDIYAKDKFGKEVRKKIDVLYEGEMPSVDLVNVALAAGDDMVRATSSASTDGPPADSDAAFAKRSSQQQESATGTPSSGSVMLMSTLSSTTPSGQ